MSNPQQYDEEKLAELMGESNIMQPKVPPVPIVRLNGDKGVFVRLDVSAEGGYEDGKEAGQMLRGVIIAVRQQLGEYTKNLRRQSNEYDSALEGIRVFEYPKGAAKFTCAEGTPKQVREKLPGLRSRRWVYMFMQGKVIKLQVKGSGLKHWFDYLNDLQKSKTRLFKVITELQPAKEENDSGKSYWALTFRNVGPVPDERMPEIATALQEFHDALRAMKSRYASAAEIEEPLQPEPGHEEVPVVDLDEEIKPEDLPF